MLFNVEQYAKRAINDFAVTKGYTRTLNAVILCDSFYKHLPLIQIIFNAASTQKAEVIRLNKRILRKALGKCTEKSVDNHVQELMKLGLIDHYEKTKGVNGEFIFLLNKSIDKNPYLLLSEAENFVMTTYKPIKESTIDRFDSIIKNISEEKGDEFVEMIKSTSDINHVLNEYVTVIINKCQQEGIVFMPEKRKYKSTPLSKGSSTAESTIKEIANWKLEDFTTYYINKYEELTGQPHTATRQVVENELYKVYKYWDNRQQVKEHIDTFFNIYTKDKGYDPKAFLIGNDENIYQVYSYLNKSGSNKQQDSEDSNTINEVCVTAPKSQLIRSLPF
ncbi:hypothetical protein NYE70_08430 [Paenibacillus sp. FSL R5-0407]|uniref:hypothetical protein n=1 Tax=Paenibacillus sp. FSL R5-0407 TaxID=2975320 RepID=UPI0030F84F15